MSTLSTLRQRATRTSRTARMTAAPAPAAVVDCAVYVDGQRLPGRWTHTEALAEITTRGEGFVWIGLHEPNADQFQGVADTFGLHELAVEDAVQAHQRPKLDRYEGILFTVLKTVCYVAHAEPTTANEIVETGEIMVFLGQDFVVTVRHGRHSALAQVRRQLETNPDRLMLGPAAVLHAIADHVVDTYLEVTAAVETDIDVMEAQVFSPRSAVGAEQIYLMKREMLALRRAVLPLATPLRRLAEGHSRLVPYQVQSYFRDVEDHLTTASEQVLGFDEMLTSLVDAVLAKITLRQNTDMRKITAWVGIVSVPTMLAGIYGQNFTQLPGADSSWGFWLMTGAMVVVCTVLWRTFRRNGWL